MGKSKNPHVEYNDAKRVAQLTLSDPDQFSPVYLQMAAERMLQAVSNMAAPRLEAGKVSPSEEPAQVMNIHTLIEG